MKAWIGAVEENEAGVITSCARSVMSSRNCSPAWFVTTASSVPTKVMILGKRIGELRACTAAAAARVLDAALRDLEDPRDDPVGPVLTLDRPQVRRDGTEIALRPLDREARPRGSQSARRRYAPAGRAWSA